MTKNNIMPRVNNNSKKIRTGWHPSDVAALERMRKPGYRRINQGLMPDATPTDKAKYEICQSILRYKQDNNLSEKEISQILGIKPKKKLECLLYCHIDAFDLDELGEYAIKLFGSFNLKMLRPGEEIYSLSQSKPNGRVRKSN